MQGRRERVLIAVGLLAVVLTAVPAGAVGGPGDEAGTVPDPSQGDGEKMGDGERVGDDERVGNSERAVDSERDAELTIAYEYRLTPDRPGEVDVAVSLSVPSSVRELEFDLFEGVNVASSDGFTATGEGRSSYAWDGETTDPSLVLTMDANRSAHRNDTFGPYVYVDTGSWALVRGTPATVDWTTGGESVGVAREFTTAGPGIARPAMAYLGPYSTHERTVANQTLTLVEPQAASLTEEPGDVLDSMATAARLLDVGDRDGRVVGIAAPGTVEWVAGGVTGWVSTDRAGRTEPGDTFWVHEDARVDVGTNLWVHEYVHTRQSFAHDVSTEWVLEGSAEYYAALVTLATGRIDFGQFRAALRPGTTPPQSESVLSRPGTWDYYAEYSKGSAVAGALDRRIRLATDGRRSLATVLRRLDGLNSRVVNWRLYDAVADVANQSVADLTQRLASTEAAPSPWNRTAHAAAFDGPFAGVDVRPDASAVAVSGPYRNATLSDPPLALTTGETVSLPVTVENLGSTATEYSVPLVVDGRVVDRWTGRLGPRETVTVLLNHTFGSVTGGELSVSGESVPVQVARPTGPRVTDLSANWTTGTVGETVALTATVRNVGATAGETTVTVSQGFSTVGERTITVDPGAVRNVTVTKTLESAGEFGFTAGDRGPVTVTVRETTPTGTDADGGDADTGAGDSATETSRDSATERPGEDSPETTTADGPGLGALGTAGALFAVAVLLAGLARRRE